MRVDVRRMFAVDQGKAIQPHPALMGNDPVSVYAPGATRQEARLRDHRAPHHIQVYGGTASMDTVMNCVDLYGTSVSTADWRLEQEDGQRLVHKKNPDHPVDFQEGPQDLYELLRKPNPFMLYDELMHLLIIDLLLVGNAYWYKWGAAPDSGRPSNLYRMAPSNVEIIPGQLGPKRYEYKPPGARQAIQIDPSQVIHFKLPNPHSHFYGLGIVQKGSRALDLSINVTDTMASYYANKADPSMIVQSDRRVPRDVFKKLQAQLRQRASGPHQAGALLVLEAGLKASSLSPSASDALFQIVSQMSENRVYKMFRASPLLFGDVEQAGAAQVISAVRREFDNSVIKPFARRLSLRISEYLTALWGVKFVIDYQYSLAPDEQQKSLEVAATMPGIMVRELRRGMKGLGLVDSESTGDPSIDEEVLNMPMDNMDATGQGGAADRPIGSEPGRPPKGANTTSFQRTRSKAAAGAKSLDDVMERFHRIEGKALVEQVVHTSVGRKLNDEVRPPDPAAQARQRNIDTITAQLKRDLDGAVTTLERALLDHAEGKAFQPGKLRDRISKSEAWQTFREQVAAAMEKAARYAASSAAMDNDVNADLDYDEIAKRVVYRKGGVGGIVKTLKKRMLAKLANDLNDDATQVDAERVIQEYLGNWREGWAETVAMTEAVHGYNEATLTALEAAGHREVYVEDGEDHDEPCQAANRSVWEIDYAREHRLEHPRCRRAFLPVTAVS